MTGTNKSDQTQPHKKGPDRHDPAVKRGKETGSHKQSKDIHEDRGIRKNKLGKRPGQAAR